jgi:uncharacterized membrane-anchored protein YitT (DUF2179 family)
VAEVVSPRPEECASGKELAAGNTGAEVGRVAGVKLAAVVFKDTLLIGAGVVSAGFGLKGFLFSSHFIDGGVTGISMLGAMVLGLPLPLLILVINLPFVALGWRQMGANFAVKSMLAIGALSVCIGLIPYPDVTPDKLLTAVFGGFFLGVGIGLAIRGGAVLDVTDIAALLISKKTSVFRVGDVILILNVVIFSAAIFFLGVEPALYSILTYLAASKTVDFLLHGLEEYTSVIIISRQSERIRRVLLDSLHRGVTVYKGRGGQTDADQDILCCIVTRLEIGKVKAAARNIDHGCFIITHSLADVEGGVVKKPRLH